MKSIIPQQNQDIAPQVESAGINPEHLLMAAVQANMAPEVIQQLLDMRRQLVDEQARQAFFRAKQAFKRAMLDRRPAKTKIVYDRDGSERYRYAPIDEIQRCIDGPLVENGFTYAWEPAIENGVSGIACVLTHVMGHSQQSFFPAEPDPKAYMAQNQKVAAARTFACRYTLQDVTGVIADEDTDGIGPEPESKPKSERKLDPEPEPPATPLTDTELAAAKAALEQSDNLQIAWRRIARLVLDRGDDAAHGVLKTFTTELLEKRKAGQAKSEELKGRPQKQTSPGGGNTALVTEDEANKLVKRIESMGLDWDWFLLHFNIFTGIPQNIPARDYERYMEELWNHAPMRNGIVYVSLADLKKLHVELAAASIADDEFKKYHGLDSTKDIELADLPKMMDFSGILAERQANEIVPVNDPKEQQTLIEHDDDAKG